VVAEVIHADVSEAAVKEEPKQLPLDAAPQSAPGPTTATAPMHGTRGPKVGRNDRCPCGSGKKYKKCCLRAGY